MTNRELAQLGDDYWDYELGRTPTYALLLGDHRFDEQFEDASRPAEDVAINELRRFADTAGAIDATALDADDAVSRDLLCFEAGTNADVLELRLAEIAVNHAIGIHVDVPVAMQQLPLLEPGHARAMLTKFTGLARWIRQSAERLVEGVEAGRTPPRYTCDLTVEQLDAHLASDLPEDPLLAMRPPPTMSEDEVTAWIADLAGVVEGEVRPAWAEFRRVIADVVAPAARPEDRPGLCWLDGGEDAYRTLLYRHTSIDLTPQQVHDVGLGQIARLADEYRELGGEVLGTTDLDEVFTRLREDRSLLFEDGPSIIAASERALDRAAAAMGDWFGRLPRASCVVRETPVGPLAFYYPPAADGSRPGTFFVNTSDPTAWHRYEIEAMSYHEGIPGHHLQLAIAGELDHVPEFRRHTNVNAYAEGWGLYSERLADEMGMYTGQFERIGMLSADSMRASRLVLDTGLHALGWSRRQAIDYFAANSPMSLGLIEAEVDRYIGWPGQACGYMIGRLEILRMRAEAMQAMGDGFDIKGFHDRVLGSGSVPLGTLDRLVSTWAAAGSGS